MFNTFNPAYGLDSMDEQAYFFAMEQAADLAEDKVFGVWFENESYDDLTILS